MRVVLDTNIVVSALIWGGAPYRLLQLGLTDEIEFLTSSTLIAELTDVLHRSHLSTRIAAQGLSAMDLVLQYQTYTESISPVNVPAIIANDPDDDHVLACALAGNADLIVSGDKHLHGLGGQYMGIPIVRASEAIKIIEVI